MSTTLAELAQLVQGCLTSAGETTISGAATLDIVAAGEITLADHSDRAPQLAQSAASAAVVSREFQLADKPTSVPTIVVEDVHAAFATIVVHFRHLRAPTRFGISDQAFVSSSAQIADNVEVHPGATIGEEVVIGRGSTIHSGAKIMAGSILGEEVTLFSNSVLYEETRIGDRTIVHAGAVIGCYGFGYRQNEGRHELSAQLGYVEIGCDVEIGACATIDRGTYGPTVIGDGTKIDNLVQIAHNCRLGKHNLICSQVGIAGSTTTGDAVVMAGQVGVRDHVHIGEGAVICSKAGVSNNVDDGAVMLGQPAIPVRRKKLQVAAIAKLPEMRRQFRELQRQMAAMQKSLKEETKGDGREHAA